MTMGRFAEARHVVILQPTNLRTGWRRRPL